MGLQIGLPERSRRAFWARLYARRRLLSDLAAPFAPMHYALIGERLGHRPNAFFDPDHFRSRATIARDGSRGLLELYLARPEPNAPSPSAEFDHGWYVSQNPDWAQTHPHPFLHFLERGLRAGKRPRQDIDVEFVRDITRGVKPRSLEEAAFQVFDRTLSDDEMGPPLNRQELRTRQDRLYADGRLRIEREAGKPERNVLVFVQCAQDLTRPTLKSRAAMTFSSTTTTKGASIRRPISPLFRLERRQPLFDASWSSGRICSSVTRRSCFSTTTLKLALKASKLFFAP